MKHLGSAVLSIYVCSALTGWRSDGPFSYTDQAIGWIRNSVILLLLSAFLDFCVLPWDLVMNVGWEVLDVLSWSKKQPGTTRHLHGDGWAAQPGASSSLKHVKMT